MSLRFLTFCDFSINSIYNFKGNKKPFHKKVMYPEIELAQLVISACNQYAIDAIVISPGSRNAPLTVGFTSHSGSKTYSVVDERCAAFFAMGIAQQTQKPVALVCTSGSALLNYYPAIAEAFYSNIPLVVISADRPKHLIDIGDGQAIRQENVYANHILYTANLTDGVEEQENNAFQICKALHTAIYQKGPVHINVPFEEPLYKTVEVLSTAVVENIQRGKEKVEHEFSAQHKAEIHYQQLAEQWNSFERKLILIGVNYPSADLENILEKYANDSSVLIMTETTSNCHHTDFINSIDQLITPLTETEFEQLRPDVLITFGGLVVSKRIKEFLRKFQPALHWHIDEHTKLDTYFCLTEHIKEKPEVFLSTLFAYQKESNSSYKKSWLPIKQDRLVQHAAYLANTPYSDLKVFEVLLHSIPGDCQLQLSNSSVIRYTQLFTLNPTLYVFCNRGTSGIDGSTSTAIGAATTTEKQTVFITGDISFYYDSNALWNSYVPKNFRIIIVNNSGGGIFKIIPGPQSTNALKYFETPHNLTAEFLAKTYGFMYCSAKNNIELEKELKEFYKVSDAPKILEIFTPSDENGEILKQYFKNL